MFAQHPLAGEAKALGERLMRSGLGRSCMVAQVHRFAFGREEVAADTCAFVHLAQRFEATNYDIRALLLEIVTQKPFRMHQGS